MNVPILVGIAVGAWFILTTALAFAGVYGVIAGGVVPVLGIAVLAGLAGAGLAISAWPQLRELLAHPATQPGMVALQVWRIEGAAFLALMALGQLPALFALPAGLGDLAVGLTAPLVARNFRRRGLVIAWNLFGLADLGLALFLGATTAPGPVQLFSTTPTSELITAFPLAIIPAFLVPLSVLLHLVSLRYLLSPSAHAAKTTLASPAFSKANN
jgi:hypothetical protein